MELINRKFLKWAFIVVVLGSFLIKLNEIFTF